MKTNILLILCGLLLLTLGACATPEQTTAAVMAVGATATALIDALGPLLPPEKLAKLQATAATIDGTVQATATAVGTIADTIANLKTGVSAQFAQVTDAMQKAAVAAASMPTREEVYLTGGGAATIATGASRMLSHYKHTPKA